MVIIKNHMHNIYCYPYMMFSSISILCCPAVVRKFFLMVSMVELENHSLKVCKTNFAVMSPLMLY